MNVLDSVERVAVALGPFAHRVVFVGGAAAPLMVTDLREERIRPTDDVDIVIDTDTRVDFGRFEASLRDLGFRNDTSEGAPICRWLLGAITVDVMPPDPSVLGFSNRWYRYVLESAVWATLPTGTRVRLASPVAFVASKLDAFHSPSRAYAGDVWASHDLEDLVAVFAGRPEIDAEVLSARPDVRAYICECLAGLLAGPDFADALEGNVEPGPFRAERTAALLARLERLAAAA